MTQEAIDLYNKGYYYYTGSNGYPLNRSQALSHFQQAAALGMSAAMNYLGVFYQSGDLVPKDLSAAAQWFYRAFEADRENSHAAYNLACAYYSGSGVVRDAVKAYELCKIVVDLGPEKAKDCYANSCNMIGCILMEHFKNDRAACPYFAETIEYEDISEAWHNLGVLAEKGIAPTDEADVSTQAARDNLACIMYEQSAQMGYAPSMDAIGRLYASHNMINEARPWIEKAAAKGFEPAKKRLKLLNTSQKLQNVSQSGSLWDLLK